MLKRAVAKHLAQTSCGPARALAQQRRAFFFLLAWLCDFWPMKPKRPMAEPRAGAPRAQAATWAWAGKPPSRLGQKWPSAILADLGRWIASDGRPSISREQNSPQAGQPLKP